MTNSQSPPSLHLFPLWLSLGVGLVAAVIYLSLTAHPPEVVSFAFSDKVGHFLAYAVLMGWFGQIFNGRIPLFLFVIGFVFMGISLEYVQGMGHHRHFEYADMVANTIGVVLGLLLTITIFKGSFHWFEHRLFSRLIKT